MIPLCLLSGETEAQSEGGPVRQGWVCPGVLELAAWTSQNCPRFCSAWRLTALGGSSCSVVGLCPCQELLGSKPDGPWWALTLQTLGPLLSGSERIFPITPFPTSGQGEMESLSCLSLSLSVSWCCLFPPLPGRAVTLEAGNEGAGCFIKHSHWGQEPAHV